MAGRPAIFFDRDNTLIVSDGYLGDPAGVVLVDDAPQAVAAAKQAGFVTVVISNQSGVARGMFDEQAVRQVDARMDQLLRQANPAAVIDHHEFCPFHPEASVAAYRRESDLRKPAPGMILRAAEALNLDLAQSWVIGDAPRDIEAGAAAGCRTILVTHPRLAASPAAVEPPTARPDHTVQSLSQAMQIIAGQTTTAAAPSSSADFAGQQSAAALGRIEQQLEHLAHELRRRREHVSGDFAVSKLLAGIVQIVVLAVLFFSYLNRAEAALLQTLLLLAVVLQTMVIALLTMGQQK